MRMICKSLAICLDDIIDDDSENEIIDSLLKCKSRFKKDLKVIFIHRNLSKDDIKKFLSRHSNNLIKIDSEITKSKIRYVWFNINLTNADIKSWRYNYRGNSILNGIKSYVKILNHIVQKENK
tara:strand:+ start:345 stop:713 length:369 start_codon:yes stop_codon:yes gene_type:complete